ncbi:MAG: hypothetical protein ABUJ92_00020 [Desulfobacterales bacterium]
MTTYSAIANSQIDADSYYDTVLAAQMRDNVLAIQEGDASASGQRVANAALAGYGSWGDAALATAGVGQNSLNANSVGQSELKDALQQSSASAASGNTVDILFTGGVYTLGWGLANSNFDLFGYNAAAYTAGIRIRNGAGGLQTYYLQARYFQASPPYNLGYGDIPLFMFALVDNATGDIIAIDAAPDAPWHYNGPTDIRAKLYKDGKSFKYCKPVEAEMHSKDLGALLPQERADVVRRMKQEKSTELFEITHDIKNSDIDIVPHPFIGSDLTGKTVVLIDPCSALCEELFLMRELGESTNDLFMGNRFVLDNTALDVRTPSGVMTVPFKWKKIK